MSKTSSLLVAALTTAAAGAASAVPLTFQLNDDGIGEVTS